MADVTLIRSGRWGLSRAVQEPDGGWTTFASQQRLAAIVEHFWPPFVNGAPAIDVVLVRGSGGSFVAPSDGNTVLFPRDMADLADVTMGELTPQQRNTWRNTLEASLLGYTFTDWDGAQVAVPAFTEITATYTLDTTLRQVARDIYRHFRHSTSRPRPIVPESHNTEYLDDFISDTTASYVAKLGTIGYDATDDEIDVGMATNWGFHYGGSAPGSIEHEAQCTYFTGTSAFGYNTGGAAVRFHTTLATDDWYYWRIGFPDDTMSLYRMNGGTATSLVTRGFTFTETTNFWLSLRMAAVGTVGNNVTLSTWVTEHGTSKPSSDPDWISATALADYEDTSVDRLDAAEHAKGGVGGHWQGVDFDNRVDWFKVRAISDRGGGGGGGFQAAWARNSNVVIQ